MKLCDRCRVPGCLLNYGEESCRRVRQRECPDVVFTNADRVREMGDKELARFIVSCGGAAYCKATNPKKCRKNWDTGMSACERCAYNWLQEPAEVF